MEQIYNKYLIKKYECQLALIHQVGVVLTCKILITSKELINRTLENYQNNLLNNHKSLL